MKNLKLIVAIVAISISSVLPASAANTNTEPTAKAVKTVLRAKIVTLLGNHNYQLNDQTLAAEVSVMLNNKNQLVVVSIDSKHEEVTTFVKSKLNYKSVAVKGIKKGTIYRVSLKMAPSNS